eukprot:TRINITY_DN291_c0_g1_i1.p2 TRINITY_DN291_c0_g1~~TRINITY_DN291_c0_g1_i1.p2  ORF type:complete len:134 (+),score=33.07 TRINITY_DN291_c0_g1_i1:1447-1848(+)
MEVMVMKPIHKELMRRHSATQERNKKKVQRKLSVQAIQRQAKEEELRDQIEDMKRAGAIEAYERQRDKLSAQAQSRRDALVAQHRQRVALEGPIIEEVEDSDDEDFIDDSNAEFIDDSRQMELLDQDARSLRL